MINNKGIAKFELLTVFVLIIVILAFLMYQILNGANKEKINVMRNSANTFAKNVVADSGSYNNADYVYLDEAIDSGLLDGIKSPVGGKCDTTETKFYNDNGIYKVTLKCGNYLIDSAPITNIDASPLYEISKWSSNKPNNDEIEQKVLYNCKNNNKLVFSNYYEDMYLIYQINKKYNASEYSLDNISECEVVKKTFYRTKKELK